MEIPNILTKQFQTGEYCADICDNYYGYGSDEISATAIAVLEYLRCNYSLQQIVVNGEVISVGKLLAGDRLEDSGADEYQSQEFTIHEMETDWFEDGSGDDYYCVASLYDDDSTSARGMDELSAIATAIFKWLKDCCDLRILHVNGQTIEISRFLGEPEKKRICTRYVQDRL